jgi:hypothetical protein
MLHAPHRLEPERLGQLRETELVQVDVPIALRLARVLEDRGHPDVHGGFPLAGMVREGEPAGQAGPRREA